MSVHCLTTGDLQDEYQTCWIMYYAYDQSISGMISYYIVLTFFDSKGDVCETLCSIHSEIAPILFSHVTKLIVGLDEQLLIVDSMLGGWGHIPPKNLTIPC